MRGLRRRNEEADETRQFRVRFGSSIRRHEFERRTSGEKDLGGSKQKVDGSYVREGVEKEIRLTSSFLEVSR